MSKLYVLSLLCIVNTIAMAQSNEGFNASTFVNEKSDTLLYQWLKPVGKNQQEKFPLVLFLHGAGERGKDNTKQLKNGASVFLKDENRKTFPAYVVFPQCPEADYWASVAIDRSSLPLQLDFDYQRPLTKSLQLAIDLVNSLIKSESIDTTRIYIVGLSMGGMGTFEAVYHYSTLFAAAIPMCGGGDTLSYGKKKPMIPLWIFHGDADNVVEVKHSRQMVHTLKEFSSSVKYTEYPGVRHNSWDYAFADPDLLSWLFAQKLNK